MYPYSYMDALVSFRYFILTIIEMEEWQVTKRYKIYH